MNAVRIGDNEALRSLAEDLLQANARNPAERIYVS